MATESLTETTLSHWLPQFSDPQSASKLPYSTSDISLEVNKLNNSNYCGAADNMHFIPTRRRRVSRMEDLPFDVHCEIASHLDYRSVLKMASTNRHFYKHLNPKTLMPTSVQCDYLKEADLEARNVWLCFGCHKFLPKHAFGDKMRKTKDGDAGKKLTQEGLRRCWACAINEKTYRHLQPVKKQGVVFYFCHQCGRMQTKSQRCTKVETDVKVEGGRCLKATICSETKPVVVPAPLERLSPITLERIVRYAGLLDAIHLHQVNRYMRDTVDTCWVPLHKRFQFIKKLEPTANGPESGESDPGVDDTAVFPCYGCFVAKPGKRFSENQHSLFKKKPGTFWRRRCDACVDFLYHAPGRRALCEFNLRSLCKTCGLLKHKGETCQGCVQLFRAGEIDTIPNPTGFWTEKGWRDLEGILPEIFGADG